MNQTIQFSEKMSTGLFKNVIYKMCLRIIYLLYKFKKDLILNNYQWLICHKTKLNLFRLVIVSTESHQASLILCLCCLNLDIYALSLIFFIEKIKNLKNLLNHKKI